mmetsp:Transcript_15271/g.45749  ORF Transcript_15271/g.45749 Transcript_15271/m.45749 type:complete len:231 (+) Transcript_15271:684-1376(+)
MIVFALILPALLCDASTAGRAVASTPRAAASDGPSSRRLASCADSTFWNLGLDTGKGGDATKDCSWVARTNVATRCGRGSAAAECPATCGTCPTEEPPAAEPGCSDSTSWQLGNSATKTCAWVAERPNKIAIRCGRGTAADECKATCGTCDDPGQDTSPPTSAPECSDATSFKDIKDKTRECSWVAKRTDSRCKKYADSCRATCGLCAPDTIFMHGREYSKASTCCGDTC